MFDTVTDMIGSHMLAEILPAEAVAREARGDPVNVVLFPEERVALGDAVEKRRAEFTTARACARDALAALGLPPQPILSGARGEPRWPAGIVGSITHCEGYRACAVARASDLLTLGIDAEPHQPLPDGVLGAIALAEERAHLQALARGVPKVHWDRLLFSAKESVYKAWFQLTSEALGFDDAALVIDPVGGVFTARLLVPPRAGAEVSARTLPGRWLARDGLLLTAIGPPRVGLTMG